MGAVLTGALSYGPKYQIGESKVKDGWTFLNNIVEYKGEDKIKYCNYVLSDSLAMMHINGNNYPTNDTINKIIFLEGDKRYRYLNGQIDYIKESRKTAKKDAKLRIKQMKMDRDLEILRR